ncbi:putative leucine-rich repeat domain, L domain-containing protein [Medicago truncatula]|nr:putative F-box/LRR-repeat protein 23 [Medicago truncatula]RHN68949.1 putative leucine-rich repeat domain, L domain-containing protein [Medicago truncatula]
MPKYIDANPWEMEKICYNAVKLSCGHLESIIIEDYYGTSDLLKLIADNGSHLRCMKVMNYNIVTDEEFSDVVRKLPRLEKVFVPVFHTAEATLEALGRSCPLLKWLQYNSCSLDSCDSDKMAFLIAETMPGLCHLDMRGHKLTELGVLAIIDKCPLLEYLDISFCLNLNEDLKKRCIDQIKDLQLPYVIRKGALTRKGD